ncbi:hypothetical protein Ndes2526B_g03720 [Nannochloris sp. 'desiccata']
MRHFKSALSIAVLLAVCQIATAQEARRSAIDGRALADTIHDFTQELRENIARDVAIWRERSQKMRQEIRDRLKNDEISRRRLLTTGAVDATKDSWELILDAGGAIKNVIDAKKVKIHEFFADVLGSNWASFLPNLFTSQNFSWDSLGLFDYRSNIQDLVSHDQLHNFQMPQNLGELYTKLDTVTDAWCTEAEYDPPQKIPTTCAGPSFTLSYVPKSCIVKSAEKTIVCDPAKLVMVKTPGECTLKHYTAFSWSGKRCRFNAEMGTEKEKVIGGGEYQVDLTDFVRDKIQDVVAHYVITCTADVGDVRTVKVFHDARDAVIGSDATGDNRALTAGATYTCTVSAQNLMGTGPATAAAPFTTIEP